MPKVSPAFGRCVWKSNPTEAASHALGCHQAFSATAAATSRVPMRPFSIRFLLACTSAHCYRVAKPMMKGNHRHAGEAAATSDVLPMGFSCIRFMLACTQCQPSTDIHACHAAHCRLGNCSTTLPAMRTAKMACDALQPALLHPANVATVAPHIQHIASLATNGLSYQPCCTLPTCNPEHCHTCHAAASCRSASGLAPFGSLAWVPVVEEMSVVTCIIPINVWLLLVAS